MAETFAEIPNRDVFKASEVCDIAQVQPYVLRSWEQEFPNLGLVKSGGGPRIYRRADVERVLRIKQLVFGEGLTLAGARRRLDGDEGAADVAAELPRVDDDTRTRLVEIKRELRALLDMLDGASARGTLVAVDGAIDAPRLEFGDGGGAAAWPPKGQQARRKGPSRTK